MRSLLALCTSIAVAAFAADAHAIAPHDSDEVSSPSAPAPPSGPKCWYGWQLLLPDALALGLIAAAPAYGFDGALVVPGTLTYMLAGPAVHSAHLRPGVAVESLLLRGALGVAGGLLGMGLGSSAAGPCVEGAFGCIGQAAYGLVGLYVGALVGMAGASAIDAAAMSWEPAPAEKAAGVHFSWTVAPRVTTGGAGISLLAIF